MAGSGLLRSFSTAYRVLHALWVLLIPGSKMSNNASRMRVIAKSLYRMLFPCVLLLLAITVVEAVPTPYPHSEKRTVACEPRRGKGSFYSCS